MDVPSTTVVPPPRPGRRRYLGVYEEDGTAVYLHDDGGEIRLRGDFTLGYPWGGAVHVWWTPLSGSPASSAIKHKTRRRGGVPARLRRPLCSSTRLPAAIVFTLPVEEPFMGPL